MCYLTMMSVAKIIQMC